MRLSLRLLAAFSRLWGWIKINGAIVFIHAVVALVNCLFILVFIVWPFYIAYSINSGSFPCVNCKCLDIVSQWVTGFRFLLPSSNFSGVFRGVKTVPKHFETRILTKIAQREYLRHHTLAEVQGPQAKWALSKRFVCWSLKTFLLVVGVNIVSD